MPVATESTPLNSLPSIRHLITTNHITLNNEGSTARDHLANERTFLAWIRTALALVGVGIGLLKVEGISNAAGYLVLSLGVIVLLTSTRRYLHVMRLLSQSQFEPNVRSVLGMVTVILVVVVIFCVLFYFNQL